MYIDDATFKQNGKTYRRCLLRESYRKNGKVKNRTIGNLSRCSDKEIQAIKLALKHKDNLSVLESIEGKIECEQGLSCGTIVLLKTLADSLGITKAVGNSRDGKLGLWQMMARIIDQGSRLSAVRLAGKHAICDLLDLEKFNEEDLYRNLDWLCDNQKEIEKRLFKIRCKGKTIPALYLYDVTSSYLEGVNNELGNWGYNRDGKKGKMQIVIGLLTDEEGGPVSVEVFKGNTNDIKTVLSQIKKLAGDFGIKEVTLVGDRGMIKSGQIKDLEKERFHYITALTRRQMETLLKKNIIQLELFDENICEVENDGIRYILRKNPVRKQELEQTRQSKIQRIKSKIEEQNKYLKEHPRATVSVALTKLEDYIKKLKQDGYIKVEIEKRTVVFCIDEKKKAESILLDGCYTIKTDLSKEQASKETVHQRYKDLANVETGFRTMKTGLLETRPIYVQKEKRTKGHVFVVMLAYCIVRELKKLWKDIDLTVEEGIKELNTICSVEIHIKDAKYRRILKPMLTGQNLLKYAGVTLPHVMPLNGVAVVTKKKLAGTRK